MTCAARFHAAKPSRQCKLHAGFTLVEMMIALLLGMSIILAVTSLALSAGTIQSTQNNAASVEENASYALNNITRSVRQAGFINYDMNEAPDVPGLQMNMETMAPGLIGLDASTLKANSDGIDAPIKSTNHFSDILAIRFVGSGNNGADNTILNCAGFGVPALTPGVSDKTEAARGWSIYYVANDASGEPNLYCKYRDTQFTAQAIAKGIESFQVLYGIDTSNPANGIANQFLCASEINALDSTIAPSELNRKTNWKKVTAVKIAVLVRGVNNSELRRSETYHLFGEQYSQLKSNTDQGTKISSADIPDEQQNRFRQVFGTTIELRNSLR